MTRRVPSCATAIAVIACSGGCRPTLDDHPWLIEQLQILGWKTEPAEAPPGGDVTFQVFALDPAGPADTATTSWTLCHAGKPLDEDRAVSPACVSAAVPDAVGDPVQLTIPPDACRLFGPDTPQPEPGQPPSRPRDPDVTGGYFQPVTLALGASVAVGLQRVTCDLPDASLATARAFQAAYVPNRNPSIIGLDFSLGGAALDPAAVPRGGSVTVTARWSPESAEAYPRFDRASSLLVQATESLLASWSVTGGELTRASDVIEDSATTAVTAWRAPEISGTFGLAFLLRDSRGGTDAVFASLVVAP